MVKIVDGANSMWHLFLKKIFDHKYLLSLVFLLVAVWGIHINMGDPIFRYGDESRNLLNSMLVNDYLREGIFPLQNPIVFAQTIFDHYPALSIQQYPPLFYLLQGILFFFGTNIFVGQLSVLFFAGFFIVFWFSFIRKETSKEVAFISTLLLFTSALFVKYLNVVMTEMPTLVGVMGVACMMYCYIFRGCRAFWVVVSLLGALLINLKIAFILPGIVFFSLYMIGRKSDQSKRVMPIVIFCGGIVAVVFLMLKFIPQEVFQKSHYFYRMHRPLSIEEFLNISNYSKYALLFLGQYARSAYFIVAFLILGLWRCWLERRELGYYLLLILLSYWGILSFVITNITELRFLLPVFPVIYFFVGYGIVFVINSILKQKTLIKNIMFLVLAISVATFSIFGHQRRYAEGYQRAAREIFLLVDGPANVLFDGFRNGTFIYEIRKLDPGQRIDIDRAEYVVYRVRPDRPWLATATRRFENNNDLLLELKNKNYDLIVIEENDYNFIEGEKSRLLPKTDLRNVLNNESEFELISSMPVYSYPGYRYGMNRKQVDRILVYRPKNRSN